MKARAAKSKVRPDEALPGAVPAYAASRRAYLLTVYYAKGHLDISFVTVQLSHDSVAHRFADLPGAFDYLLGHVDGPQGKSGEP
jgi:hypothetical protein